MENVMHTTDNCLIYKNGLYGAKIGRRLIFTRQGAIEQYKLFLAACYNNFTVADALVLSEVEDDMLNIGFTLEELESMENEFLQAKGFRTPIC